MMIYLMLTVLMILFITQKKGLTLLFQFILKWRYRLDVSGLEHIPQKGAVILFGNHVSFIDFLCLKYTIHRRLYFMMPESKKPWYFKYMIKTLDTVTHTEALHDLLQQGEAIVMFPENDICQNGQMGHFKINPLEVKQDLKQVDIIPFFIQGLWGSFFSFANPFYQKINRTKGRRNIFLCFGKALPHDASLLTAKQSVLQLSFFAWKRFVDAQACLSSQWLSAARSQRFKTCVADTQGRVLSHLALMTAVFALSEQLKKQLSNQKNIAILLPNSAANAISNMALMILGKVPVHLNYTLSQDLLEEIIEHAEINHIIASKQFLERLSKRGLHFSAETQAKMMFLEDIMPHIKRLQKLKHAFNALCLPQWLLKKIYIQPSTLDDDAFILFSSGSESKPKGVVLSQRNIICNLNQIDVLLHFKKEDVLLNSLPVFHAFGLTVTMMLPLCRGIPMVCIADPTDVETISKMALKHRTSIIFGTSTLFRLYCNSPKVKAESLRHVRFVIAGAEKLKDEVKKAFKMKFGLNIHEGYGATETSPVASVNLPHEFHSQHLEEIIFSKHGSVGLPLPGTVIQIIDPETNQALPIHEQGMIAIGGNQVMKHYLHHFEKSGEVLFEQDGILYYKTGDKGCMDEQGFVSIIDRYSRFAKIGGEMISLTYIEEQINSLFDEHTQMVAVAIDDDKKGEAIVLLVRSKSSLKDIQAKIEALPLPPLIKPKLIFMVENIPMLGSGKVDFANSKKQALLKHKRQS